MIELNLLPENMRIARKKKPSVKFNMPQVPMLPVVIGAASLVLLIHLIIGITAFSLNYRLKCLNSSLKKASPQEETAISLKKEADMLSRKLRVIDSLSSTSLIWSKKLSDLNRAMTESIWLTSLYLDERKTDKRSSFISSATKRRGGSESKARQMLVLKGSAYSLTPAGETAVIGKFIESLKKNQGFFMDFEDIELSSTQRKQLGETEVMDFIIECYFKSGRRYFDKLQTRT